MIGSRLEKAEGETGNSGMVGGEGSRGKPKVSGGSRSSSCFVHLLLGTAMRQA